MLYERALAGDEQALKELSCKEECFNAKSFENKVSDSVVILAA